MMFSNLSSPTKQILTGNLLMILCFLFYIAWWLIAFHPTRAVKGMRSGWLLIPACIFGVWAIVEVLTGCSGITGMLPAGGILTAAVAVYVVLFAGTMLLLHRQVTTELLLIVGWTALMIFEYSTLSGLGIYAKSTAAVLMCVTVIGALISLICYLLYYNLDRVKGYVDGLIPLVFVAVMMTVVSVTVIKSPG